MSTNLYGSGDNCYPENSHVIPTLIRSFHETNMSNATKVLIWSTDEPRREFMYVYDMAEASAFLMELDKKIYNQHAKANAKSY
jgi:GDP-L-fucose synthase